MLRWLCWFLVYNLFGYARRLLLLFDDEIFGASELDIAGLSEGTSLFLLTLMLLDSLLQLLL